MIIIYAQEQILNDKPSIFLAGPSPRNNSVISWRIEALQYLSSLNFDGYIFVPEPRNGIFPDNYISQIEWESEALETSTSILFWIPRDLKDFPGFTTNDEWGYWKCKDPNKLVLGFPVGTPKIKYQEYYANKLSIPVSNSLHTTIDNAILKLNIL